MNKQLNNIDHLAIMLIEKEILIEKIYNIIKEAIKTSDDLDAGHELAAWKIVDELTQPKEIK